ncbi:MAG TPA: cytochrome c [Candidatus Cybelea sp.]|nr:cytochrome c [Candidatus Cybelea sp.]
MKSIVAALAVCASLLAVSVVLAQSGNTEQRPVVKAPKYDPAIYAELQKAPEKARNRGNPLANDPDAVAAGALLFRQHCAECHGHAAEGSPKAPSLLVPEVQEAAPGTLFWVITNGVVRRKMPVWSKLPEPQRWQLVRYIKSLGGSAAAAESAIRKP